jgi:hypothetical protein
LPRVRMTRQPPRQVPGALAVARAMITHSGVPALWSTVPLVIRARVMMPVVFCASLVPWGQRAEAGRADLAVAEAAVAEPSGHRTGDGVDEVGAQGGHRDGGKRREHGRGEHFGDDGTSFDG